MATEMFKGGHSGSLWCVDYADGLIATGGENGQMTLWDLATKNKLFQYINDDADTDCTSVCFSKDGSLLFAAFADKICQFDKRTFSTPVETYTYNNEEINQLNISDKETFIAACDDSGETKIISLQEKKIYKTLRHKHSNICSTVAFRPQRQWEVVTGGLDCKLIHWYYGKPKVMNEIDMQELLGENPGNAQILNPPFIHHIDFSTDGSHLACALGNGTVEVFDCSRKHLRDLYSLSGHYQGVSQVSFVNNRYLLSGSNDKQMIVWDLEKVAGANQQVANPQMANGHAQAANGHHAHNGHAQAANGHHVHNGHAQAANGHHVHNGHAQAANGHHAHNNHAEATNGHGHNVPDANGDVEEQNNSVPEDCKVYTRQLPNKVNWLKSIIVNDQHHVFVADETTDLTMISTGLL